MPFDIMRSGVNSPRRHSIANYFIILDPGQCEKQEKKSEAYLIVNSWGLVISSYCDEVILREEDALLILFLRLMLTRRKKKFFLTPPPPSQGSNPHPKFADKLSRCTIPHKLPTTLLVPSRATGPRRNSQRVSFFDFTIQRPQQQQQPTPEFHGNPISSYNVHRHYSSANLEMAVC